MLHACLSRSNCDYHSINTQQQNCAIFIEAQHVNRNEKVPFADLQKGLKNMIRFML